MNFQPRYDEEKGIYRDCKWCGGKGCLACPGEADAEYKRQFPDGPKPIATFHLEDLKDESLLPMLKSLFGPEAIMSAKQKAYDELKQTMANNPSIETYGLNPDEIDRCLWLMAAERAGAEIAHRAIEVDLQKKLDAAKSAREARKP